MVTHKLQSPAMWIHIENYRYVVTNFILELPFHQQIKNCSYVSSGNWNPVAGIVITWRVRGNGFPREVSLSKNLGRVNLLRFLSPYHFIGYFFQSKSIDFVSV